MAPGPVNLYACRGLAARDAECTLAINALTFVQREDFGLSKLEAVEVGKKKKRKTGILVGKIAEGSAAAQAGLNPGDVIVKAGGFKLYSPLHLKGILTQIAAGKKIKLTLAGGETVTLKRVRKRPKKK